MNVETQYIPYPDIQQKSEYRSTAVRSKTAFLYMAFGLFDCTSTSYKQTSNDKVQFNHTELTYAIAYKLAVIHRFLAI
ncbi:MAG: hypothetical protein HC903_23325 [Methylacidiphilales bacterium]|nr:hypothetical protein [Candidatus Methylacidiphilales bacterium]NJR17706.1 hypothetical protein [Calothrix sp. CSU_2_0]